MTSRAITVPAALADALAARVASGEYASEGDVIRDGLLALEAQEGDIDAWLTHEGAARVAAWRADPGRARPAQDAFARVRQRLKDSAKP